MKGQINLSAIILAAGKSSRMDGANKLLLPFQGKTIIEQVVDNITSSGISEVVVVTGWEREAVEKRLRSYPVKIIANSEFNSGMSSSLRKGVAACSVETGGILICLGDMPLISVDILRKLIDTFSAQSGKSIIVPVHEKRWGKPVIFPNTFRNQLLSISGDQGARSILKTHSDSITELPVSNPGVLVDVDNLEQYQQLLTDGITE